MLSRKAMEVGSCWLSSRACMTSLSMSVTHCKPSEEREAEEAETEAEAEAEAVDLWLIHSVINRAVSRRSCKDPELVSRSERSATFCRPTNEASHIASLDTA